MGVYDTVLIPCPRCGEKYKVQTKSGKCFLNVYDLYDAPQDTLGGVVAHAPFTCEKCGNVFTVYLNPIIR